MAYPIPGAPVTCAYGVKGPQWMSGWHQGVDFGAKVGTPVKAVADGVVVGVAIWGSAFGGYAPVVRHRFRLRSYYCVYGHVSKTYVKVGDKVKLGQHIADVGVEGNAHSGPHLHFEAQATPMWRVGKGINPKYMFMYKGRKSSG